MTQEERGTTPPRVDTVFGCPICSNIDELSADIAFLGFPYEHGAITMLPTGKSKGAGGIRADKRTYKYFNVTGGPEEACGWYDYDTGEWKLRGVTMADCGDVTVLPVEGERNADTMTNCERLTKVVRKILDRGAFPVVMGGDHTQPYPILKAFDNLIKYHPIDIVQFDAHDDFRTLKGGPKINDADCMARCSELPFVHHITNIGLNPRYRPGPSARTQYDVAIAYGVDMITPKKFRQMGASAVVESIPKAEFIYVTLDIDCMDVCTVVPGISGGDVDGLSFLDVEQTLTGIPTRGKVVGFDITGLIPSRDPSGVTMRVCTNLMADFLAAVFPSKR